MGPLKSLSVVELRLEPALEAAIDAVEAFEEVKRTSSGRLSRLADWFKPSKHEDERLPMDARSVLGGVHPPPKSR